MSAKIQLLRDTQTGWNSVNPVLAAGEIGLETSSNRFKVGDGTTQWGALTYFVDDANISFRLDGKANTSHTHGMADLTAFEVTSPVTGQTLQYNGTKWVNAAAASGGETISSFLLMGA
jgi:hypothetical protein